jgi:hypothetical protein
LGVSRKHALRGRSRFSAAKARRKGEKMEKTGVKKKEPKAIWPNGQLTTDKNQSLLSQTKVN